MNDQQRLRMQVVILGLLGIFTVVGLAIWLTYEHHKSPSYSTTIVDRDTGQILQNLPNQTPESSAAGKIFIFGSEQLLSSGATQDQFNLLQTEFTKYASNNLANQYQTLTIIPADFKAQAGQLTGRLRLGETDNIVNFQITLSQLKYVQLVITDNSGVNGGSFDSGKLTVPGQ